MRLKTKVMAVSVTLLACAITVCCLFILRFARQNVMDSITAAALSDYASFYDQYADKASVGNGASERTLQTVLKYQLAAMKGNEEYTLQRGDDMLANGIGVDAPATASRGGAKQVVFESSEMSVQYTTAKSGSETYFLVVGELTGAQTGYTLSLVRNISAQSDALTLLAVKCLLTGTGITLFAALLMLLAMQYFLKPIQSLKSAASELARGHYEKRIACTGRDELAELADDFNSMADAIQTSIRELQRKSEQQQAFINDLSHELKTPVTSILLCSETLLGRSVPQEAQTRSLERIHHQSRWLEKLSQKLMTLVLLQGEITLRPEDVSALLDAVRETTADSLEQKGVTLSVECKMERTAMDFDLMRSALANLVENAKNASEPGQQIELSAYGGRFEVTDHGKGIPPEEIARITEPFYRIDRSRSKLSGGSGLGLALVKRIAEAHGARLEIESALGEGTTMRLVFPQEMTTV